MAYCENCGAMLREGAEFCHVCGTRVNKGRGFTQKASDMFNDFEDGVDGAAKDVRDSFSGGDRGQGRRRLKDDRSLIFYILLNIITIGIYTYYFIYRLAKDMNTVCEDDGQNTAGVAAYIILSFITCGFYNLYWEYKITNRMAANAPRYNISINETGTAVLIWELIGYITCWIGRYVALHIIIKNSNALFAAYNREYGLN